MKSTSKEADERRDRRSASSDRPNEPMHAPAGERRAAESRGLGEAMVDALEDILQWERASERQLKVAGKATN